jgi:23S rRNA (uracil1939-C5)-methyltransferase
MATSGLRAGDEIELTIEKAAAGGRMIARHDGQVVLVAGTMPGERVRARIEKADRRLAFAQAVEVVEASPDRRTAFADPLCGGCVFSHIEYPRQLDLKREILRDAFHRIGRMTLDPALVVAPSPESGYRMRARLHVSRGRIGFYREGTHTLCDPAQTAQLTDSSLAAAQAAVDVLDAAGVSVTSVELSENMAGSERALALAVTEVTSRARHAARPIVERGAARGVVIRDDRGGRAVAGELVVSDPLEALTNGRASGGFLRRHPESFFQSNRFLVPALVGEVVDQMHGERIVDLYAGVGLFSVALAAARSTASIVAVEGDRSSGADLQLNAGAFGEAMTIALESVEDYLRRSRDEASTTIVDPPRTGISPEAMDRLVARRSPRLVYVSCDPATMARDARKLLDAGYELTSLRGFDLFPNTAHVESLGVFEKISSLTRGVL